MWSGFPAVGTGHERAVYQKDASKALRRRAVAHLLHGRARKRDGVEPCRDPSEDAGDPLDGITGTGVAENAPVLGGMPCQSSQR